MSTTLFTDKSTVLKSFRWLVDQWNFGSFLPPFGELLTIGTIDTLPSVTGGSEIPDIWLVTRQDSVDFGSKPFLVSGVPSFL